MKATIINKIFPIKQKDMTENKKAKIRKAVEMKTFPVPFAFPQIKENITLTYPK